MGINFLARDSALSFKFVPYSAPQRVYLLSRRSTGHTKHKIYARRDQSTTCSRKSPACSMFNAGKLYPERQRKNALTVDGDLRSFE